MLTELGDGVYVLEIAGPIPVNAGIVVGDESVAVIDTGTVESDAKQLLDAVARVTERPVRYVINTHHHGDHSFGNWWFLPAVVVGHDRCRLRLVGDAGERHREMMARLVPAAAEQVQAVSVTAPAVTFERSCELHLGGVSLRLDYLGRAHTDNDIVVRLAARDLVFAGDLIEQSAPPVVIEGFPAEWGPTLRVLETASEGRFIPGHGTEVDGAFVGAQAQAFEQVAASCAAAGSAEAALEALESLPAAARAVLGAQAEVAVARYFATVDG